MSFRLQPAAPARLNRCQLFGPGSRPQLFEKMAGSAADVVNLDLEDSVASHKKSAARETVFLALEAAARPGLELAVRINPPSEQRALAEDDLDRDRGRGTSSACSVGIEALRAGAGDA